MPKLGAVGTGRGAIIEPIFQLLSSNKNSPEWGGQQKGALKSLVSGRQFPQTRVFQCGWAEHNKCIFCIHDIVEDDCRCAGTSREEARKRGIRDQATAMAEQISRAPVGDLHHRAWECVRH